MRHFFVLFRKDLLSLWRGREYLVAAFGFGFLLVVVASFAFRQVGYGTEQLRLIAPGILWLVFLFSASASLNQTFQFEREGNALAAVLLAETEGSAVFFAKVASNLLFLTAVQLCSAAALAVFLGVELWPVMAELVLVTVMAELALVSVGTLLSAMAAAVPGREILLPVILFPLLIPLTAGAVFVSTDLLRAGTLDWRSFWFVLLGACDVIFLALSWALFDVVVRE